MEAIRYLSCAGCLLLILPVAADAQQWMPTYAEHHEIQLDGRLNEAVWTEITPVSDFYQQSPSEGEPPTNETLFWMVYDESAIYVAAKMVESDLSQITSRSLERDSYYKVDQENLASDQDAFAIVLDTFNDDRSAFAFVVTPDGVRSDVQIYRDAEGTSTTIPWNRDWNTFWDTATIRTADGWSVEMRIPFSSLRFTVVNDRATMGVIAWRYRARNIEFDIFPAIPNTWQLSPLKPSQALDVDFVGVSPKNPAYVTPYGLGGINQLNTLGASGTAYEKENDPTSDVGLDVKYNINSELVLDVTINTDFAQVESDDQQINLTRFSLYYPEKRQFFQERSDLFNYGLGGRQLLFNSRSIGLVEGTPVPIIGGARLTGRVGAWDVGLMNMQTGKASIGSFDSPSENFGVARLRRQVFDNGSYVGALVTSKNDFDGAYNVATGLDADLRIAGPVFMALQAVQSFNPDFSASSSRFASIVVQRRIQRGLYFGTALRYTGRTFDPGLGYFFRPGYVSNGARIQYTWIPKEGPIQNHYVRQRWGVYFRTSDRVLETLMFNPAWTALLRSGARIDLQNRIEFENLNEGFQIGDLDVPAGEYKSAYGEWLFELPTGGTFRGGLELRGGLYYDGLLGGFELTPKWSPSPHFTLGLDYVFSHIELDVGTDDLHLARLRVTGALNRSLSALAFLQYGSDVRQVLANLRLRYNPREGNDLYLVINEGLNTDLERDVPFLPRLYSRSVLVKYRYTFIL